MGLSLHVLSTSVLGEVWSSSQGAFSYKLSATVLPVYYGIVLLYPMLGILTYS